MPDNLKLIVTKEHFSSQDIQEIFTARLFFGWILWEKLLRHNNLAKGGSVPHTLSTDYLIFFLRCIKSEGEIEKLQAKLVEMKKKLDNTTAAMQELGRENQSLQV